MTPRWAHSARGVRRGVQGVFVALFLWLLLPTGDPVSSARAMRGLAAAGVQMGTWLDPYSLLMRTAASAIEPSLSLVSRAGPRVARVSVQPMLIGGLLLLLVALNAARRRFFCNVLCPLGALYGWAARFSLLHPRAPSDCRSCGACARDCAYGGAPGAGHLRSECSLCLNCAAECPDGVVDLRFSWPQAATHTAPTDLGRRGLWGATLQKEDWRRIRAHLRGAF